MRFSLKRNDKIGLFIFIAIVISTSLTWLFEERFTKQRWKEQHSLRYKMADDIIENQLLIGKTKQEVNNLLGPTVPSSLVGKEHLVYPLGKPQSFFANEKEILVIIFENKKAVKVVRSTQ